MFSSSMRAIFTRSNKFAAAAATAALGATAYTFSFGYTAPSPLSHNSNNVTACDAGASQKTPNKRIVIVGGGTAWIGIAAMLDKETHLRKDIQVTLVEPKTVHYYQPLWTLVGGGVKSNKSSVRPMTEILPRSTHWLPQAVQSLDPDHNKVVLQDGSELEYYYLIVAAGRSGTFCPE